MNTVPERIAAAARARIDSQQARRMQAQVSKAFAKNRPVEAEPDADRRLRRVQAVAAVGTDDARKLISGENPANILSGDELYGAERLIGETVDFLPVSFLSVGQEVARAIGRVIHRNGSPVGSGFLISGSLFVTNNHVIGSAEEAKGMLLEFDYETDAQRNPRATTRFVFDPAKLFLTNDKDDLDFTVLAVGERVTGNKTLADFGFCPLSDRGDKHMLGEFVNVIQHPEGDFKQVVLRENKLISRLDTVLHYEADTQPGSSGSAVFNDEWEAVALHHWGGPHREQRTRDGQPIPAAVNEGIRISAIVRELSKPQSGLSANQQALLKTALELGDRRSGNSHESSIASGEAASPEPPHETQPAEIHEAKTSSVRLNADGSATFSLEVNVRVVGGRSGGGGSGSEKIPPNPDYSERSGYDPDFLTGFPVPIPAVTARASGTKARLLDPAEGANPWELKYEHFSIVMNKTRRLAFVTAANIDGAKSRKVDRASGRVTGNAGGGTSGESAEASEKWYGDKRISDDAQTNQALYDRQQPRVFDRGHQVRREDPVWGDNDTAESANADTFHFTNCCPQEFRFNEQARFWAGIENYVLDNARAEKARVSVFSGPVFAASDPPYRGIRVPLQFYKVIARIENGDLKATAFLADQTELVSALPERLSGEERFDDVGRVRQYLTTVAEIEELTGLDFGPLRDHDTNAAEGLGARRPLRTDADLSRALGSKPESISQRVRRVAELAGDKEALPSFSAASLSSTTFDWRTALSTALASQLAYADEATVVDRVRHEWECEDCKYISVNDTQCFVASTSDTALVAFRGSESVGDWLANFNVQSTTRSYGKIHRGFFRAFEDVQEIVLLALAELNKKRIIVTGHSLGGALATVFAAEAMAGNPVHWVYTFGQPCVGIGNDFVSALNEHYGQKLIRFVNDDDIVPRLPPSPYRHVGRLIHFDASGDVGGDSERFTPLANAPRPPAQLTQDEFEKFQAQLRARNSSARGAAAEGLFPSFSDHVIARYIDKIAAHAG